MNEDASRGSLKLLNLLNSLVHIFLHNISEIILENAKRRKTYSLLKCYSQFLF